ncbi:MAG: hypothetical protein OXG51_13450 [Gammaproteobacteria bacterium]|nr:hypothetical protein [Gammaproteobacteria bacterium]
MNRTIRLPAAILCAAALTAAAHAKAYETPRTDFGHPDLQGTWTNATITALERPDQFDRLVLTEAEAADWERQTAGFFEAIDNVPEGGLEAGEDVGGYNSFWMDPGTRALRVDGEARSSIITSPQSGKLPYRLGARIKLINFMGNVINAFDGPEQRPLGERCVVGFGSTGGPPMLPVLYNNNYQIVQTPDHVMIHVEMNHDARIIRLGGEHPPAQVRPWMGDSIGRWEDDALVVETTNFHPGQTFRAAVKHQLLLSPEGVVKRKSSTASRWRTQPFTRSLGAAKSASGPPTGESTNTPATRATTPSPAFSPGRAWRKPRRPEGSRNRRHAACRCPDALP